MLVKTVDECQFVLICAHIYDICKLKIINNA